MIVFFTSNKRGAVAIELDIMGSGRFDRVKLTVENKHKTLLVASKFIGLETPMNIHVSW